MPAGVNLAADLAPLHALCYALLSRTPPDGSSFARSVAVLLHRESGWRSWKNRSAPEFEKTLPKIPQAAAASTTGSTDSSDAAATAGVKRKFGSISGGAGPGGGRSSKRSRTVPSALAATRALKAVQWCNTGLSVSLWDVAADHRRAPRHRLQDFVEPMREALDPDSGIEPEYYPSANKLFVWRTYRMLAAERLGDLKSSASASASGSAASGAASAAGGVTGIGPLDLVNLLDEIFKLRPLPAPKPEELDEGDGDGEGHDEGEGVGEGEKGDQSPESAAPTDTSPGADNEDEGNEAQAAATTTTVAVKVEMVAETDTGTGTGIAATTVEAIIVAADTDTDSVAGAGSGATGTDSEAPPPMPESAPTGASGAQAGGDAEEL